MLSAYETLSLIICEHISERENHFHLTIHNFLLQTHLTVHISLIAECKKIIQPLKYMVTVNNKVQKYIKNVPLALGCPDR